MPLGRRVRRQSDDTPEGEEGAVPVGLPSSSSSPAHQTATVGRDRATVPLSPSCQAPSDRRRRCGEARHSRDFTGMVGPGVQPGMVRNAAPPSPPFVHAPTMALFHHGVLHDAGGMSPEVRTVLENGQASLAFPPTRLARSSGGDVLTDGRREVEEGEEDCHGKRHRRSSHHHQSSSSSSSATPPRYTSSMVPASAIAEHGAEPGATVDGRPPRALHRYRHGSHTASRAGSCAHCSRRDGKRKG
ncbi:hypothetical protein E2562_026772 [Oryza meyeriana var. granulata]|uniref:Uncharacterized protein n=1 Tax=Oryza meyeriana var. granulata TaxID=110450 RepID=A0A6G1C8Z4_9ORYZ|nr:hypothetical protein E2562_026772 [Oryza meyeriana var. granulata]